MSGQTNRSPFLMQKPLIFESMLEPESAVNNTHFACRVYLDSPQGIDRIYSAFCAMFEKDEYLNAKVVIADSGEPCLENGAYKPDIQVDSCRAWGETEIKNVLHREVNRSFRVTEEPLYRVRLYQLEDNSCVVLLVFHHIVSDLYTLYLILDELSRLLNGEEISYQVEPMDAFYKKAVEFQDSKYFRQGLDFWEDKTKGLEPLDLPLDGERAPGKRRLRGCVEHQLSPEKSRQCDELAQPLNGSRFNLFLALWHYVLHRYTGREKICVGIPFSVRNRNLHGSLKSNFINLHPSVSTYSEKSFQSFIREISATNFTAKRYSLLPFHELVKHCIKERSAQSNPLFQTMFRYLHQFDDFGDNLGKLINRYYTKRVEFGPYQAESIRLENEEVVYDVALTIHHYGDDFILSFEYDTALFSEVSIGRLKEYYIEALNRVLETDADFNIKEDLISPSMQQVNQLLDAYTPQASQESMLLHERISEIARSAPGSIAVRTSRDSLSYLELEHASNRLANYLKGLGAGPGKRLCIALKRSPQIAITYMASLKLGMAYIPVDPGLPAARVRHILDDSGAEFTLTDTSDFTGLAAGLVVDLRSVDLARESHAPCEIKIHPLQTAYILYTSGSTGKPKGVEVTYRALSNFVESMSREPGFSAHDVILGLTSISFDISGLEVYLPLVNGGTLHLLNDDEKGDIDSIVQTIREQGITFVQATPATWSLLMDADWYADRPMTALCGGEAISPKLAQQLLGRDLKLWNVYGPTETTIWSSCKRLHRDDCRISIGRPISQTFIRILDRDGNHAPVGARGELCIGGEGLAQGYCGKPSLTADKFVPYALSNSEGHGSRLYRTGDIARMSHDLELLILGRMDNQIKIRGYRIELGEIENQISQVKGVKECVAHVRRDKADQLSLIAYYRGEALAESLIMEQISRFLPHYSLPQRIVHLHEFPKNNSGKIERSKLPLPVLEGNVSAVSRPLTAMMEKLNRIWKELLETTEDFKPDDDFFAKGGNSLLAIKMIHLIRKNLGLGVNLGFVFNYPSLAAMALHLGDSEAADARAIMKASDEVRAKGVPLSYAQERLWLTQKLEGAMYYNNMRGGIRIIGDLRVDLLEDAIFKVITRHESLRTNFKQMNGSPVQVVKEIKEFKLRVVELPDQSDLSREAVIHDMLRREVAFEFDIEHDQLFRFLLIKEPGSAILVANMHHIVSDGWSTTRILLAEIGQYYDGLMEGEGAFKLDEPAVQYADFSIWERRVITEETLADRIAFWKSYLNNAPVSTDLRPGLLRSEEGSKAGKRQHFDLDAGATQRIDGLSEAYGFTRHEILLGIFSLMLHRRAVSNDIVLGFPLAGRDFIELASTIGYFIKTMPLRSCIGSRLGFVDHLNNIRNNLKSIYLNQDVPFQWILKNAGVPRIEGVPPLIQIWFNYEEEHHAHALKSKHLRFEDYQVPIDTSRFEFSMDLYRFGPNIRCVMEYQTSLYDGDDAARIEQTFKEILRQVTDNPHQNVLDIPVIGRQGLDFMNRFNDTKQDIDMEKSYIDYFLEAAARSPKKAAVTHNGTALSYQQLDRSSAQLAAQLVKKAVRAEDVVCLLGPRSLDFMSAMFGIMRAGACYLPLNPADPVERWLSIIEESKSRLVILLDEDMGRDLAASTQSGANFVTIAFNSLAGDEAQAELPKIRSRNLAYCIFTSGSTGRPKGTLNEHLATVNHLLGMQQKLRITENDLIAQNSPQTCDISLWQMLIGPFCGATTVILDEEKSNQSSSLFDEVDRQGLTILEAVPTLILDYLAGPKDKSLASLRCLISCGEPLPPEMANQWLSRYPGIPMMNAYGPSECADDVTVHEISQALDSGTSICPIGRPIANTSVYVLKQDLSLCEPGEEGAIWVGGLAVGRGYVNQAAKTAQAFFPDPYSESSGARMYHTGDLGKINHQGDLLFLGRKDEQVKIRGFRIELGEIEAALLSHANIKQCAALVRGDVVTGQRIIAYYTSDSSPSSTKLRSYLEQRLPPYMVPNHFCQMPQFLLNSNLKIDKKKLPEVFESSNRSEQDMREKPLSPIEKNLISIWQTHLDAQSIGIHDNFFDLGGHSLVATRIVADIKSKFNLDVSLRDFLKHPTIFDLKNRVEEELLSRMM